MYHSGLAKKFVWVFPVTLKKKKKNLEWTFWPTQYIFSISFALYKYLSPVQTVSLYLNELGWNMTDYIHFPIDSCQMQFITISFSNTETWSSEFNSGQKRIWFSSRNYWSQKQSTLPPCSILRWRDLKSGLLWCLGGRESTCRYRRRGFDPWIGKIP